MGNKPDAVWTSSQLISSLTSQAQILIFSYSPEKKCLLAWSENSQEILGVKDFEIATNANLFLRHVHPDDRFALLNDLELAFKEGGNYRSTYRWIRPDNNELRWLHCRGKLQQKNDEQVFEGIILDLSSEFTGQVARIAGPDSLAGILAAFPTMVFTIDRDLRILRLNRPPAMKDFNFGEPSFDFNYFGIGKPFAYCFSDKNKKNFLIENLIAIIDDKKQYFRTRIQKLDSVFLLESFPLKEQDCVQGILVIVSDISETVKLERDLAKLHKVEGLRLLASGVAHNFNNSLQAIVGYAASIKNNPDNKELIKNSSAEIIETVTRASELSRQLFAFDNPTPEDKAPLDVNLAVMAAVQKVENLFSSGFKITASFGTPPRILANQNMLVDAFLEIFKNAGENCNSQESLAVRTSSVTIEDDSIPNLAPGKYVLVRINDSGPGMSAYVKERCLDPFYTTKTTDPLSGINLKGQGLGLSTAYAVAREHGGTLLLNSAKPTGTEISIYLPIPLIDPQDLSVGLAAHEIPEDFQPEVLIIDDNLMVLQTIKQVLESANLKCITAEDSTQAITLFKRFSNDIKLVLIDSILPGMSGATLLRRIKKIKSSIKALGFSGGSAEAIKQLNDAGAITVLKKPVEPSMLKSAVLSIINAKEAA